MITLPGEWNIHGLGLAVQQSQSGLLIRDLILGGAVARNGGVRLGDRIAAVNGVALTSEHGQKNVDSLMNALKEEMVTLSIRRGKSSFEISLRIEPHYRCRSPRSSVSSPSSVSPTNSPFHQNHPPSNFFQGGVSSATIPGGGGGSATSSPMNRSNKGSTYSATTTSSSNSNNNNNNAASTPKAGVGVNVSSSVGISAERRAAHSACIRKQMMENNNNSGGFVPFNSSNKKNNGEDGKNNSNDEEEEEEEAEGESDDMSLLELEGRRRRSRLNGDTRRRRTISALEEEEARKLRMQEDAGDDSTPETTRDEHRFMLFATTATATNTPTGANSSSGSNLIASSSPSTAADSTTSGLSMNNRGKKDDLVRLSHLQRHQLHHRLSLPPEVLEASATLLDKQKENGNGVSNNNIHAHAEEGEEEVEHEIPHQEQSEKNHQHQQKHQSPSSSTSSSSHRPAGPSTHRRLQISVGNSARELPSSAELSGGGGGGLSHNHSFSAKSEQYTPHVYGGGEKMPHCNSFSGFSTSSASPSSSSTAVMTTSSSSLLLSHHDEKKDHLLPHPTTAATTSNSGLTSPSSSKEHSAVGDIVEDCVYVSEEDDVEEEAEEEEIVEEDSGENLFSSASSVRGSLTDGTRRDSYISEGLPGKDEDLDDGRGGETDDNGVERSDGINITFLQRQKEKTSNSVDDATTTTTTTTPATTLISVGSTDSRLVTRKNSFDATPGTYGNSDNSGGGGAGEGAAPRQTHHRSRQNSGSGSGHTLLQTIAASVGERSVASGSGSPTTPFPTTPVASLVVEPTITVDGNGEAEQQQLLHHQLCEEQHADEDSSYRIYQRSVSNVAVIWPLSGSSRTNSQSSDLDRHVLARIGSRESLQDTTSEGRTTSGETTAAATVGTITTPTSASRALSSTYNGISITTNVDFSNHQQQQQHLHHHHASPTSAGGGGSLSHFPTPTLSSPIMAVTPSPYAVDGGGGSRFAESPPPCLPPLSAGSSGGRSRGGTVGGGDTGFFKDKKEVENSSLRELRAFTRRINKESRRRRGGAGLGRGRRRFGVEGEYSEGYGDGDDDEDYGDDDDDDDDDEDGVSETDDVDEDDGASSIPNNNSNNDGSDTRRGSGGTDTSERARAAREMDMLYFWDDLVSTAIKSLKFDNLAAGRRQVNSLIDELVRVELPNYNKEGSEVLRVDMVAAARGIRELLSVAEAAEFSYQAEVTSAILFIFADMLHSLSNKVGSVHFSPRGGAQSFVQSFCSVLDMLGELLMEMTKWKSSRAAIVLMEELLRAESEAQQIATLQWAVVADIMIEARMRFDMKMRASWESRAKSEASNGGSPGQKMRTPTRTGSGGGVGIAAALDSGSGLKEEFDGGSKTAAAFFTIKEKNSANAETGNVSPPSGDGAMDQQYLKTPPANLISHRSSLERALSRAQMDDGTAAASSSSGRYFGEDNYDSEHARVVAEFILDGWRAHTGGDGKRQVVVKNYSILKPISRGAYGSVYLAQNQTTGELVAMKVLRKMDLVLKNQVKQVLHERNSMLVAEGCPYVCTLIQTFQSRDNLYLIMEFLPGGDLFSLLCVLGALGEDMVRFYVAEMVLALNDLHKRGVIHRDIKPDNVLIARDGHIRLTDFGLAKIAFDKSAPSPQRISKMVTIRRHNSDPNIVCGREEEKAKTIQENDEEEGEGEEEGGEGDAAGDSHEIRRHSGADEPPKRKELENNADEKRSPHLNSSLGKDGGAFLSPVSPHKPHYWDDVDVSHKATNRGREILGTPNYMAPELLRHSPEAMIAGDRSIDWWSLGVMTYELLDGGPPFVGETEEEVFSNILQGEFDRPNDISDDAWDLIRLLLVQNPIERLKNVQTLKKHPFFHSIDWETLTISEAPWRPETEDRTDLSYFAPRAQVFEEPDINSAKYVSPRVTPSHHRPGLFSGFAYGGSLELFLTSGHRRSPSSRRRTPMPKFGDPWLRSPPPSPTLLASNGAAAMWGGKGNEKDNKNENGEEAGENSAAAAAAAVAPSKRVDGDDVFSTSQVGSSAVEPGDDAIIMGSSRLGCTNIVQGEDNEEQQQQPQQQQQQYRKSPVLRTLFEKPLVLLSQEQWHPPEEQQQQQQESSQSEQQNPSITIEIAHLVDSFPPDSAAAATSNEMVGIASAYAAFGSPRTTSPRIPSPSTGSSSPVPTAAATSTSPQKSRSEEGGRLDRSRPRPLEILR